MTTDAQNRYEFASDNTTGMMPELLSQLASINAGAVAGYGKDPYTARARKLIQEFFERDAEVHFVFNGTAANVLLLRSMMERHQHALAHLHSHLDNDECSAPEFFGGGTKVRAIGSHGTAAKIRIEDLQAYFKKIELWGRDVHFSPPGLLSITQSTELGAVYQPSEIKALTELARSQQIKVHMDGARFFYALEKLGCTPAELTWKAGVDALSLGGTKIGMGPTEAVVIFNPGVARTFNYVQKQGAQLASKMRFLSAPWIPLLEKQLWKNSARNARERATELEAGFKKRGIPLLASAEVNSVFARLTEEQKSRLEKGGWHVYDFQENTTRFMTSWLTTPELVTEILDSL